MSKIELIPVFSIGQTLYYVLPGSEPGILTDITYRLSSDLLWYHVTFDPNSGEVPCREFELTTEKIIV